MDLEQAYERFAAGLFRHALALTRNRADAEDAVQTVFAKLAARLGARAAIEDLEAYLHAAARREALRIIGRRRGAALESPLVESANGTAPEEAERVNRALGALPPEQREVVLLHVYEGMTFRRIGEALGIPADTAASRYRYAREKLKEMLGGD